LHSALAQRKLVNMAPIIKEVVLKLRLDIKMIWFEELIMIAEDSSSAPLYPLLKREDENI